jgi:hypothetical protein
MTSQTREALEMKTFVFLLLVAFLGAAVPLGPGCNDALAISGCCKHRADQSARWVFAHRDFQRCKQENQDDDDNLFKPLGHVWWDTRC